MKPYIQTLTKDDIDAAEKMLEIVRTSADKDEVLSAINTLREIVDNRPLRAVTLIKAGDSEARADERMRRICKARTGRKPPPVPDAPPADPPVGTCWRPRDGFGGGIDRVRLREDGRMEHVLRRGAVESCRLCTLTLAQSLRQERAGVWLRVPDSPATEGENRHG